MRIMPIHINMVHLMGEPLPIEAQSHTLEAGAQRIWAARDALIRVTGQDFGYDVAQWHQYLISAEASEDIRSDYTLYDLHERFEGWRPNREWQRAVEEAQRLASEFPNCPRCGSFASLHKISHGLPGAKEEMWLCNICKIRISIALLSNSHDSNVNES